MLASELAEILLKTPNLHVCMEYIPYNGPPNIFATPYPEMGVIVLDYGESEETDY